MRNRIATLEGGCTIRQKIINHKMFALHSSSFRRELLTELDSKRDCFRRITFWPNYENNSRASAPSREQPVEMRRRNGRISAAAMSAALSRQAKKRS